jgi:hypothetical protein
MNLQLLRAYIAYRRKAKHRKGHGVHSPFMYELVRSVFLAKKEKSEPENRSERIRTRLNVFCEKKNLQLVQVKEKNDLIFYTENCIALLAQPSENAELWEFLQEHKSTKVTADCWKFGLAISATHLQKQAYVVKL